jgi:hypothetical protein
METEQFLTVVVNPRISGMLVTLADDIIGNNQHGEDIVQDVVTAALDRADRFETSGRLVEWLKICVRNSAIKLRKLRLHPRDFDVRMPLDPEELYLDDPEPESALDSTNPLFALAALIDQAPLATRRTAVRRLLSLHNATVMGRVPCKGSQRLRADLTRLRDWIAKRPQNAYSTSNSHFGSIRERIESALIEYQKLTRQSIPPEHHNIKGTRSRVICALEGLAAQFEFPVESFGVAVALHDAVLRGGLFYSHAAIEESFGIPQHSRTAGNPDGNGHRLYDCMNDLTGQRNPVYRDVDHSIERFISAMAWEKQTHLSVAGATEFYVQAWTDIVQLHHYFWKTDALTDFAFTRFRRELVRGFLRTILRVGLRESDIAWILK